MRSRDTIIEIRGNFPHRSLKEPVYEQIKELEERGIATTVTNLHQEYGGRRATIKEHLRALVKEGRLSQKAAKIKRGNGSAHVANIYFTIDNKKKKTNAKH